MDEAMDKEMIAVITATSDLPLVFWFAVPVYMAAGVIL